MRLQQFFFVSSLHPGHGWVLARNAVVHWREGWSPPPIFPRQIPSLTDRPHLQKFLLAEILKASALTPSTLLTVITTNGIQPRWEDMPLPQSQYHDQQGYLGLVLCQTATLSLSSAPGPASVQDANQTSARSLNSCKAAYTELLRTQPQTGTVTPHIAPTSTLKRPFQPDNQYVVGGREIRPKPSGVSATFGQSPGSANEGLPRRKRGRPTKKEQQARADAQRGMSSAPPSQLQVMTPTPLSTGSGSVAPQIDGGPLSGPVEEMRPATTPQQSMTVTSILTPTQPKSESQSGSSGSSGKRRRGRSGAKLQSMTDVGSSVSGAMPTRQQEYRSPSRRPLLPPLEDTRSATRRHHDNILGLSREPTPSEGHHIDSRHPPPPRPAFHTMEPRPHVSLPPPRPPPPPPQN